MDEAAAPRTIDEFIARYEDADGGEVWSLGGSLNGVGKEASAIALIDDPAERQKVIDDFAQSWGAGTQL